MSYRLHDGDLQALMAATGWVPMGPRNRRGLGLESPTAARLACLLEAVAPKPGNVHPQADFGDMTFGDLAASAQCIGDILEFGDARCPGEFARDAALAIQTRVGKNTYLGTILLLAILGRVSDDHLRKGDSRGIFRQETGHILERLTPRDAELVYDAIRVAAPGGLGKSEEFDVRGAPPVRLLDAMRRASDQDLIARQYGNGFHEVYEVVLPLLCEGLAAGWTVLDAIVWTHVALMSRYGDSLIARKCGPSGSDQAKLRAAAVLASGAPFSQAFHRALSDLDGWLRGDGHRRNPGTTADLIAAGLFILLRTGELSPP